MRPHWAIYRTGEQIDRELERYFAIRKEIEERFAQTDGKSKFIAKESIPAFQRELEELGKKQVELCLDLKVNLPEDCLIEPDELGALVEAGIIDPPDAATAGESAVGTPRNPATPVSDANPNQSKAQS